MGDRKEPYVVKDVAGKLGQGFLRNPLTAVLGIVILVLGWIALNTMPREEDPKLLFLVEELLLPCPVQLQWR